MQSFRRKEYIILILCGLKFPFMGLLQFLGYTPRSSREKMDSFGERENHSLPQVTSNSEWKLRYVYAVGYSYIKGEPNLNIKWSMKGKMKKQVKVFTNFGVSEKPVFSKSAKSEMLGKT